jgi:hypothetical protein
MIVFILKFVMDKIEDIIINEIEKFLTEVGDASNSPLPRGGEWINSIDIEEYE